MALSTRPPLAPALSLRLEHSSDPPHDEVRYRFIRKELRGRGEQGSCSPPPRSSFRVLNLRRLCVGVSLLLTPVDLVQAGVLSGSSSAPVDSFRGFEESDSFLEEVEVDGLLGREQAGLSADRTGFRPVCQTSVACRICG